MELSQKLKELRKKQGLTQLELAERLFVSRQAISGWEAGTSRPSTENLQSLSRLFNIPLETLLDDTQRRCRGRRQRSFRQRSQAKRRGQGTGTGERMRRYKAIVMVIVLLAILLTTAVLAHRRTAQEKTGVMTFSEMECEDIDLAGAKSVPIEGFGKGR